MPTSIIRSASIKERVSSIVPSFHHMGVLPIQRHKSSDRCCPYSALKCAQMQNKLYTFTHWLQLPHHPLHNILHGLLMIFSMASLQYSPQPPYTASSTQFQAGACWTPCSRQYNAYAGAWGLLGGGGGLRGLLLLVPIQGSMKVSISFRMQRVWWTWMVSCVCSISVVISQFVKIV